MVNKNISTGRLERFHEYLNILKSIQQYDSTRFVKDPFIHGTGERNLHLAIEYLLDIGNHIIADRGYEKPESYADIFRILHQHLVIQYQLYQNLEGMAAFRNVLVHDYMRWIDQGFIRLFKTRHNICKNSALFSPRCYSKPDRQTEPNGGRTKSNC